MGFLSLLADSAWLAVVSAILGSALTFFANKSNNKKEMSINDRQQLSKDQYQFIAELKSLIQEQGEDIEFLKTDIRGLQEMNNNLMKEITELQKINLNLMVDNKELQFKIQILTDKLGEFQDNKNGKNKGEEE